LTSLPTQRGSRSTKNAIPPRYCARLRKVVAEQLVVGLKVRHVDPALGHARGATGLEDVRRLAGEAPGDPAANRPAAKPLVLEVPQPFEVVEAVDFASRIEIEASRVLEPERTTGFGIEVPLHHFADVGVEPAASLLGALLQCRIVGRSHA